MNGCSISFDLLFIRKSKSILSKKMLTKKFSHLNVNNAWRQIRKLICILCVYNFLLLCLFIAWFYSIKSIKFPGTWHMKQYSPTSANWMCCSSFDCFWNFFFSFFWLLNFLFAHLSFKKKNVKILFSIELSEILFFWHAYFDIKLAKKEKACY